MVGRRETYQKAPIAPHLCSDTATRTVLHRFRNGNNYLVRIVVEAFLQRSHPVLIFDSLERLALPPP